MTDFRAHCSKKSLGKKDRQSSLKRRRRSVFSFVGSDRDHNIIEDIDGSNSLSYAEKFELICDLSLFEYQVRNNTTEIPRLDKSVCFIRKPTK